MSQGLFYRCPCYISRPADIAVALLSTELSNLIKNILICVQRWTKSYGFGTTWGRVINDRIVLFGWTNTLRTSTSNAVNCNVQQRSLLYKYVLLIPLPLLRWTCSHRRLHSYHFNAKRRVCGSICMDAITVRPDYEIILVDEWKGIDWAVEMIRNLRSFPLCHFLINCSRNCAAVTRALKITTHLHVYTPTKTAVILGCIDHFPDKNYHGNTQ